MAKGEFIQLLYFPRRRVLLNFSRHNHFPPFATALLTVFQSRKMSKMGVLSLGSCIQRSPGVQGSDMDESHPHLKIN